MNKDHQHRHQNHQSCNAESTANDERPIPVPSRGELKLLKDRDLVRDHLQTLFPDIITNEERNEKTIRLFLEQGEAYVSVEVNKDGLLNSKGLVSDEIEDLLMLLAGMR